MREAKRLAKIIRRRLQSSIYRVLFLVLLGLYVRYAFVLSNTLYNEEGITLPEAAEKYGLFITVVLYSLTLPIYINVPVTFFNIMGWLLYNPFSRARKQGHVTLETTFICFRVVTRGLFPGLVSEITEKNLETCRKVGIKNFKFEIVTDKSLDIPASNYVREVVVPADYHTPNGTLFKARALHYCFGQNINILSRDDWIVHLDEETLLTEGVLHGILDFVSEPSSNIGQGVITYGGCGIENWITTLLDGMRVAVDYGLFRFALQCLHRPVFGFKGSFIVVKMGIEKDIGFDFGPKESIAEDLRFALTAWHNGYKFDFVQGIMKEKSTFSLTDYVKQRKRWFIGHFHVIWGSTLPLYSKMAVMPMHVGNLLLWSNVLSSITSYMCPLPMTKMQITLFVLLTGNALFMLFFGNFMSVCRRRYSLGRRLLMCFLSQLLLPLLGVTEAYATLKGFLHRNQITFDIVEKEKGEKCPSNGDIIP